MPGVRSAVGIIDIRINGKEYLLADSLHFSDIYNGTNGPRANENKRQYKSMTDEITNLLEVVPIFKRARVEFELMNYHEYIINARDKKYTYREIANALKKSGITVSTKTLQRFIRRKNAEANNIHS